LRGGSAHAWSSHTRWGLRMRARRGLRMRPYQAEPALVTERMGRTKVMMRRGGACQRSQCATRACGRESGSVSKGAPACKHVCMYACMYACRRESGSVSKGAQDAHLRPGYHQPTHPRHASHPQSTTRWLVHSRPQSRMRFGSAWRSAAASRHAASLAVLSSLHRSTSTRIISWLRCTCNCRACR